MRRAALILLVLAAACSRSPSHGTVMARQHSDAYSYWTPPIQTPEQCTTIVVGKSESEDCTPGVYIPGHYVYIPESWSLKLHPASGHTGWHVVSKHAFDACAVGDFYPDCSSGAKAGPA